MSLTTPALASSYTRLSRDTGMALDYDTAPSTYALRELKNWFRVPAESHKHSNDKQGAL